MGERLKFGKRGLKVVSVVASGTLLAEWTVSTSAKAAGVGRATAAFVGLERLVFVCPMAFPPIGGTCAEQPPGRCGLSPADDRPQPSKPTGSHNSDDRSGSKTTRALVLSVARRGPFAERS
jgi:hypothetical protein